MYDPRIGRWLSEDPIGFAAGDGNLFRYVHNDPTGKTDPSGLQEGPARGSWDFWRTRPADLNISGSQDVDVVRRAIAALDTTFGLDAIPHVDAYYASSPYTTTGTYAPAGITVTNDVSAFRGAFGGAVSRAPTIRPSELARINLRVNLLRLKQDIVTRLYLQIRDNPPPGGSVDMTRVEMAANRLADDLIRMTDRFLRTHPGARPSLGARGAFGMDIGTTRQSHPWCADWAEAMDTWIGSRIRNVADHPANEFWDIQWGQANNGGQHNFMVITPRWHTLTLSRPGTTTVDQVALLFDPWRDLMPRVYPARPLTFGFTAPTHIFTRARLAEMYYWDNDPWRP